MNLNTNEYLSFLMRVLSPPRYQHSLCVMKVMADLSEVYRLDSAKAMMAGLLHDAARDFTSLQLLTTAGEAKIKFSHPCEQHPVYLHAPVSAYLVSKELGVTDQLVLDAISTHSYVNTRDNFDVLFCWCLRAADILAPVQEWKGMRKLKSIVYAGRMEEAALLQSGWLIEYFEEQSIPVHPNLVKKFQALSAKLSVTNSFFARW